MRAHGPHGKGNVVDKPSLLVVGPELSITQLARKIFVQRPRPKHEGSGRPARRGTRRNAQAGPAQDRLGGARSHVRDLAIRLREDGRRGEPGGTRRRLVRDGLHHAKLGRFDEAKRGHRPVERTQGGLEQPTRLGAVAARDGSGREPAGGLDEVRCRIRQRRTPRTRAFRRHGPARNTGIGCANPVIRHGGARLRFPCSAHSGTRHTDVGCGVPHAAPPDDQFSRIKWRTPADHPALSRRGSFPKASPMTSFTAQMAPRSS